MILSNKPLGCSEARELMFDYLDGELDKAATGRLESHIEGCEPCRCELCERRNLLTAISSVDFAPPAGFHDAVMARVREAPQESSKILTPKRSWNTVVRRYGTTAAAACAVLLLIVAGRGLIGRDIVSAPVGETAPSVLFASNECAEDADTPIDRQNAPENTASPADGSRVQGVDVFAFGETTSAVTTLAPPKKDDNKPSHETHGELVSIKQSKNAVIDTIIDRFHLKTTDRAVLIGYLDDFAGLLPETDAERLILGETYAVDHYVIGEDAADKLAGYVTLLENAGAAYRTLVPENSEVTSFELVLIVGAHTAPAEASE